ncbi:MAG: sporulation protein YqfD [Lachnospiraceae bacterium]
MFFSFTRFFRGYLRVKISGPSPERFLNLCSHYDMLIWNLQRSPDGYEFFISLPAFFSLKPLLKKTRTTIHVQRRFGLPFFLKRYQKRKMFFIGIGFCCLLLYISSGYLWRITIEGNRIHSEETLRRYLAKVGVSCGVCQNKLDCEKLEEQLRLTYPDIIWVSARLKGTHLYLEIKENMTAAQSIENSTETDSQTGYDLVAPYAGKVVKIVTRSGTPKINIGDKVKKGSVFISGALPILNDSGELDHYDYTKADGDVYVERTLHYRNSFSLKQKQKVYDEKPKNVYSCKICQFTFSFPFWKKQSSSTEVTAQTKQLHLMNDFYLPVWLEHKSVQKYHLKTVSYSKKQAETKAKQNLEIFLRKLQKKNVEILQKNVMIDSGNGMCQCKGTLRVMEKVGIYQKNTEKKQDERQIVDEFNGNDT